MESNDTLLTATQTDINAGEFGEFIFNGVIGDNPDTENSADDVDLYTLELTESTHVAFDIDTSLPDSSLDSILRVFDSEGNELSVNSPSGLFTNNDAFIAFQPSATGTYYVGVSGSSNLDYDPSVIGSGTNERSTGNYELIITTVESTTRESIGGAQLLKDIFPDGPGSNPSNFTEFDGKLVFSADNGEIASELWISDGTTDGTQLLQDIRPGLTDGFVGYPASSYPDNLTVVDGQLFFSADNGLTGDELFVSDGTTEGTQLLKDINTTPPPVYDTPQDFPTGLPLSSNPSYFSELNGTLFFIANDGITGNELWASDGTADGTQLLKDINPDSPGSNASNFAEFDGKLFFSAEDGVTGRELWVSDGTTEGTQLLKDIQPDDPNDLNSSYPSNFIEFDGKLFFTVFTLSGDDLWVTDGTADGTQFLRAISGPFSSASNFTEVDGKLFFETDTELWISDGTADGTQILKEINAGTTGRFGPISSDPSDLTAFDGKLFFSANDGVSGRALWVSDGTTEGTQILIDINVSDNGYEGPSNLTVAGDFLFFTADDGFMGEELWISDGTAAGTQLFQEINPGAGGSNPGNLRVVGDQLFFTANDGTTGNELWAVTIPDSLNPGDNSNPGDDSNTGDDNGDSSNTGDDNNAGNGSNTGDDNNAGDGGNTGDGSNTGDDNNAGDGSNAGDDNNAGDENDNSLNGTTGNDVIDGLAGNDTLRGRRGNDLLKGGSENDDLFGDAGDDTLNGNNGDDRLFGSQGNDDLQGGSGNDQLFGGRDQDTLQGGAGDDAVRGNDGDDTVIVTDFNGVDLFNGGSGNDRIQFIPPDGRDLTLSLDLGNVDDGLPGEQVFSNFEEIITGRGNDRLLGNSEANTLNGGDGNDELIGGLGNDMLVGGQGVDILEGGQGNDVLNGGGGVDTFRFADDLLDGLAEIDTIQDFQSQDILDFSAYVDAGSSITATRLTSDSLRIDLSGEDTVDIFGSAFALNIAESQIL